MNAEDLKLRIIEERKSLREFLFNEWKAAQKVYETREALKRTEDGIIQEIQDNPANKNEKDRTAAKRIARINDGRYIAGLKAISDAEIERFNFQASIIDSQTRITVFMSDYEFALLGRRDAQFQFALMLAKVVQADTSIAIEVTAPKLESNLTDKTVDGSRITETGKMSVNDALKDVDANRGPAKEIIQITNVNADLIAGFLDTFEGRAVIGDWLRKHGKPVMAQVLESGIQDINSAVVIADTPVGEPVLMTRVDDAPGEHVDDAMTQILTEEAKKDIVTALHNDNDPNNPTSQGNSPAANASLPEGIELKAGIPVCKNCGIMMTKTVAGNLTHPPFASCASVESSHPDAKLRKTEGPKGQRLGGIDV